LEQARREREHLHDRAAGPRVGLPTRWLAYLGCSVSIGVFHAFNNFTLTLWLSGFTSSYLLLGLMGNSKSLEGAVVSPLVGSWSDRTWAGWLGRRRPFILVGGLLSALLVAQTPTISRLAVPLGADWLAGAAPGLVMAVVAIFLFTLTFNGMDDIHKALMVEVAAPDERNRLAALVVTVEMIGQVGLLVLAFLLWRDSVPDGAFALTGGLMAAGIVVTVLGVREPDPAAWEAARRGEAAADAGPRLSWSTALARYRPAVMLCLIQFAYWSGVNAVMPLVSVYCRDILGASVGEAQLLPALMLLSTTLLAIPMGRLGDRFGKRRVIALGYAIIAAAGLTALVITTREQGAVVFLLAGIGNAAMAVLQIPLLADLVPRQHMGAATGALAASGSIAAPLASLAAGGLSDLYGPRAIFAMMAALVAMALVLLPATRLAGEPHAAAIPTDRPKENDRVHTPV
jgi:MFS family permease